MRYERVARTAAFRDAVERVAERADRDRVAHILADGALERHGETMDRLLARHGLAATGDLLGTRAEAIATAIFRETEGVARGRKGRRS